MELVLNNYGIKLSISNNAFIVTNEEGKHRIPIRDVDTIIVCKNASLTSNVIL
ncbi:CRISPR-associated endonuclease Cas1 [Segatella albensis]|uniref:CRISPR-associated endonuclease Cas1 n=1 Tax=Segatella albensis TaxID=77768 RepID=UPI0003F5B0E8|nr:CRISPR-associated endonuclease Cas1 [Segatella albensis]